MFYRHANPTPHKITVTGANNPAFRLHPYLGFDSRQRQSFHYWSPCLPPVQ